MAEKHLFFGFIIFFCKILAKSTTFFYQVAFEFCCSCHAWSRKKRVLLGLVFLGTMYISNPSLLSLVDATHNCQIFHFDVIFWLRLFILFAPVISIHKTVHLDQLNAQSRLDYSVQSIIFHFRIKIYHNEILGLFSICLSLYGHFWISQKDSWKSSSFLWRL